MPTLQKPGEGIILDPFEVKKSANRADLIWGPTRSGKGINAWMAIYWMAKTRGKRSLYLTGEPGSMPKSIQDAQTAGLVDVFSIINQEQLWTVLGNILESGKWPVYLKKNDGTVVRDFTSVEAKCNPERDGLLIIDAMRSMGAEMIRWLADPANEAKIPMTPGKDKFFVKDGGGREYGGSSGTHIYFAQQRIEEMVMASSVLPYDKILWISREQRGYRGQKKNKDGDILIPGDPMIGPDIPGESATPRATSWFGGSYHTQAVPVGGEDDNRPDAGKLKEGGLRVPKYEYRLYLRPHPDPKNGLMYEAGNRFPAEMGAVEGVLDPKTGKYVDKQGRLGVPTYIVCTERRTDEGFVHTGLNTVYQMEADCNVGTSEFLKRDLASMLDRINAKKGEPK